MKSQQEDPSIKLGFSIPYFGNTDIRSVTDAIFSSLFNPANVLVHLYTDKTRHVEKLVLAHGRLSDAGFPCMVKIINMNLPQKLIEYEIFNPIKLADYVTHLTEDKQTSFFAGAVSDLEYDAKKHKYPAYIKSNDVEFVKTKFLSQNYGKEGSYDAVLKLARSQCQ